MIAPDTNVLVRFLTKDNPDHGRMASILICGPTEQNLGSWSGTCLWNWSRCWSEVTGTSAREIARVLEDLLSASELVIEQSDAVGANLQLHEVQGFGFSVIMIREGARRPGADIVKTFDRQVDRRDGTEMIDGTSLQ